MTPATADVTGSALTDNEGSKDADDLRKAAKRVARARESSESSSKSERDRSREGRSRRGGSYSEGQTPIKPGFRRTVTDSPGGEEGSLTPSAGNWSSNLWGLGSWLDPPAARTTAHASSASSKQRRRRRERSSKEEYETQSSPDSGAVTAPGQDGSRHSGEDDDHSDDSSSSIGSSDSSQGRFDGPPQHQLSDRLLFANRLFTPFHHPSLTASVPNLPSEVGATGSMGLGGMEDIDTVDFEGGESESEDAASTVDALLAAQKINELVASVTSDQEQTQDPRQRATRRTATVSPIVTPGKLDTLSKEPGGSEEGTSKKLDYFGPRAVEREQGRHPSSSSQTVLEPGELAQPDSQDDSSSADTHSGATTDQREAREASAALQAALASSDEESEGPPPAGRPSLEAPPPAYEDATADDDVTPKAQLPNEKEAKTLSAQDPASGTSPKPKRRMSLPRRILLALKRVMFAVLMAPIGAVSFVIRLGKCKRTKKIVVGLDRPTVSASTSHATSTPAKPTPDSPVSRTSSVRKTTKTSAGSTTNVSKSRKKQKKSDETEEESEVDDDDIITEEQAMARAERRRIRAEKAELAAAISLQSARQASTASDEEAAAKAPPSPSRLLPNPHHVDPLLAHDPTAKRVSGFLPKDAARKRGSSFLSGGQVARTDSEKTEVAASPSATPVVGTPPVPRSAVIHHTPKVLVLDLDETLIHSTSRSPTWTALRAQHSRPETTRSSSSISTGGSMIGLEGIGGLLGLSSSGSTGRSVRPHMVEVVLDGRSVIYHVYKRPYVDYFLRKVSAWYHVVVFTASVQEYADPVIDWLDGGRGLIAGRLFRDSCTYKNGSYLKELRNVDADLARVCLVDNSPASYYLNPANGIPIEGWTHDPSDEALLDLLPILDSLRFAQDVRHVLGLRITSQKT